MSPHFVPGGAGGAFSYALMPLFGGLSELCCVALGTDVLFEGVDEEVGAVVDGSPPDDEPLHARTPETNHKSDNRRSFIRPLSHFLLERAR
jgi:hypothetical protein